MITLTSVIIPKLFITGSKIKSSPVPVIVIAGGTRYPLPPFKTVTDSTVPSITFADRVAVAALTVPMNRSSCSVSTVTSYRPVLIPGIGSAADSLSKIKLSTANCLVNTPLTLSKNCFNASSLFTNQLCLGLFNDPYRCLILSVVSGTALPYLSWPTKLSNHFSSMSFLGLLFSRPSVII